MNKKNLYMGILASSVLISSFSLPIVSDAAIQPKVTSLTDSLFSSLKLSSGSNSSSLSFDGSLKKKLSIPIKVDYISGNKIIHSTTVTSDDKGKFKIPSFNISSFIKPGSFPITIKLSSDLNGDGLKNFEVDYFSYDGIKNRLISSSLEKMVNDKLFKNNYFDYSFINKNINLVDLYPDLSGEKYSFSDIKKAKGFETDLKYMKMKGYMVGGADGNLNPQANLKYSDIIRIAGRVAYGKAGTASSTSIKNISQKYNTKDNELIYFLDKFISDGVNVNILNLNSAITRADSSSFMYVILKNRLSNFDVDSISSDLNNIYGVAVKDLKNVPAEITTKINALYYFGITSNNIFKPSKNLTRSQFAAMISRYELLDKNGINSYVNNNYKSNNSYFITSSNNVNTLKFNSYSGNSPIALKIISSDKSTSFKSLSLDGSITTYKMTTKKDVTTLSESPLNKLNDNNSVFLINSPAAGSTITVNGNIDKLILYSDGKFNSDGSYTGNGSIDYGEIIDVIKIK